MNNRITGSLLLVAAVGILGVYAYGLFFAGSSIAILVLQITAFIGVSIILGLVGWIGYSIASTTPPPPPEPEAELGDNKEDSTPAAPPAPPPKQSKKAVERKPRKKEAKPTYTVAT